MITFVTRTTTADASSCGPAGVQCVNETTTQKVAAPVPTPSRASRAIATSRWRRSSPTREGPTASVTDRRPDGAARRSQIHQSDEPKSFQSALRLTSASSTFAPRIARANGAAS